MILEDKEIDAIAVQVVRRLDTPAIVAEVIRKLRATEREEVQSKEPVLPETGFLRIWEVLKLVPVSKSAWWAGVKDGRFPKSIKLGNRITVWRAEDIQRLLKEL